MIYFYAIHAINVYLRYPSFATLKKKKQVSLYQKYQGTASERCQSNPHGHAQQRTGDKNRRVLCKLFLFVILKSQGLYTNLSIPTFKHDIE